MRNWRLYYIAVIHVLTAAKARVYNRWLKIGAWT